MKEEKEKSPLEQEFVEETATPDLSKPDPEGDKVEGGMTPQEQIADLEDRNLRLLAEMQNLRNRTTKDIKDAREYAVTGFAQDMITLSENIYRAREAIPNAEDELYKNILRGIDMTIEELSRVSPG